MDKTGVKVLDGVSCPVQIAVVSLSQVCTILDIFLGAFLIFSVNVWCVLFGKNLQENGNFSKFCDLPGTSHTQNTYRCLVYFP